MKLDLRIKNWYPLEFDQPIRQLTVDEYHRMIDADILHEGERVELIDGVLIQMCAQKARHSAVTTQIAESFYPLVLQGKAKLRIQLPITLNDHTEPEPDLAVVKIRKDAYFDSHPTPEDVLLLIEVSDTTLGMDKSIKLPRYAASEIPEVWIINFVSNCIEVYREPIKLPDGTPIYQKQTDLVKGKVLSPQAIPSVTIAVDEVLI